MTFLPVVTRELGVIARRRSTHWIRVLACAVALLPLLWVAVPTALSIASVNQGRRLFYSLSGPALGYCLFIGAFVTADCLSAEKREGTLGIPPAPWVFPASILTTTLLSGLLLCSSFALLPRVSRDRPRGKRREAWFRRWHQWIYGAPDCRARFWFATETCTRWVEDRRSGALELLLCTPQTIREIMRGQQLALRRQFGWTLIAAFALTATAAYVTRSVPRTFYPEVRRWFLWSLPILPLDVWALRWVSRVEGNWIDLGSRSSCGDHPLH